MASAHIWYEWAPDPRVYANAMYHTADALRNPAAPLLFAAKQMQEEVKASFLSQTSPDGRQWVDWSDSYRPIAEEYPNEGILRRTTNLYEAATDEEAFVVSGDTLFYDTSGWPWSTGKNRIQYGWVHQEGSNTNPQRQFVGVSVEGESIIYGAFMEWFDNALAMYVTATGKLGMRGRSSLGTFVPMEEMSFRPGRRRIR
jgi:hypothetical protein